MSDSSSTSSTAHPAPPTVLKGGRRDSEELDKEIVLFFSQTERKINELSVKFSRSRDYIRDCLYLGCSQHSRSHTVTNPWAAFCSLALKESRFKDLPFQGRSSILAKEFAKLTVEEKDKYVKKYEEEKANCDKHIVVTPQGRVREVTAVCMKVDNLLAGLSTRLGTASLCLTVRTSGAYIMKPRIYCTDPLVAQFFPMILKQDLLEIAAKLEGFVLNNGELVDAAESHAVRLREAQRECSAIIEAVSITHGQCKRMMYSTYERDIVVAHNVVLETWPFPSMTAPSTLGSSLTPLNILLVALKGSEHHPPTCKWRKLSDDEAFERNQRFLEKVKDGDVLHKRKVQGSAAKSKRARLSDDTIDDGDESPDSVE